MIFSEVFDNPFLYFFDSSKRIFFLYLLSSFFLGLGVLLFQKQSFFKSIEGLFHKKIWQHRSTRVDVSLLFFNSILRAFVFLATATSSIVVAKAVVGGFYNLNPSHQPWTYNKSTIIFWYSIVSFVLLDFTGFFQHYLFHKVPFLWRFHKVHHAAEVMTPLTLYRTHPLESVVGGLRRVLVIGFVSGWFIYNTKSVIDAYAILGVNAFDFVFNFFGSNLRHSHVWLSFGKLNHFFVSPAQHQVHHSRNPKHFDKNLGFAFSLWDKMFGTFQQVGDKEFLIFGVRGEKYNNLWDALKAPFNKTKMNS